MDIIIVMFPLTAAQEAHQNLEAESQQWHPVVTGTLMPARKEAQQARALRARLTLQARQQ